MEKNQAARRRWILPSAAGLCVLLGATTLQAGSDAPPAKALTVVLDHWLALGPVPVSADAASPPDPEAQKKAFETDFLASCGGETQVRPLPPPPCSVGGHALAWKALDPADGLVDLAKGLGAKDYAVAYALADVDSPAAGTVLLGLGSDDAIEVWLNGKVVHSNWVMGPLAQDQDLVPVELKAGRNQLPAEDPERHAGLGLRRPRRLDDAGPAEAMWLAAQGGDLETGCRRYLATATGSISTPGRWRPHRLADRPDLRPPASRRAAWPRRGPHGHRPLPPPGRWWTAISPS